MTTSEEFSYIVIALTIAFVLFGLRGDRLHVDCSLRISRILLALALTSVAILFRALSTLFIEYRDVLCSISMTVYIACLVICVYGERGLRELSVALIALVFATPLPRPLLDRASLALSKFVGLIVSFITGASYVSGKSTYLVVQGPEGKVMLEIAAACSGIVSISSIIAVVPILLVLLERIRDWKTKIKAITLGLAVGVGVAFLGNVVRIALIVEEARRHGLERALDLFHSTPSIIYASLATIATFLVVDKYVRKRYRIEPERRRGIEVFSGRYYLKTLVSMLFALLVTIAVVVATPTIVEVGAQGISKPVAHLELYTYSYVVENLPHVVFTKNLTLIQVRSVPYLANILGSSIVEQFYALYRNKAVVGYLEVGEAPYRFHSWTICLSAQHYAILDVWTENVSNHVVTFVVYKGRYGEEYVLGYSIFRVPICVGPNKFSYLFIRVTAVVPVYKDRISSILLLKKFFEECVNKNVVENVLFGFPAVGSILIASYVTLALCVSYAIVVTMRIAKKILYRVVRWVRKLWTTR